MSRCNLSNRKLNTEVYIGWDPGLQTYFCSVFDYNLGGGVESEPIIQFGSRSGEVSCCAEPLLDVIMPYTCSFDRTTLLAMLKEDREANSERIYGFDDEVEDDEEDI